MANRLNLRRAYHLQVENISSLSFDVKHNLKKCVEYILSSAHLRRSSAHKLSDMCSICRRAIFCPSKLAHEGVEAGLKLDSIYVELNCCHLIYVRNSFAIVLFVPAACRSLCCRNFRACGMPLSLL